MKDITPKDARDIFLARDILLRLVITYQTPELCSAYNAVEMARFTFLANAEIK